MSSIKKNFIYNVLYQIVNIIIPIVTAPYISRVLGPNGIGEYSYSFSVATYFALMCLLGVSEYGNRSIARVRENKEKLNKIFWGIYSMQIITSIIAIILYILYVAYFIDENKIIFIIQIIYVASFIFDLNWLFCGLEKFKITVLRNISIKIFTLICIFIFVKNENDLVKYALIMSLSSLLSQLIFIPFISKYIGKCKLTISDITVHIKPNLILFIPAVSFAIFKIMDKVMIGSFTNMINVGYYDNAVKIIDLPMGLITALGVVMLPRMSNLVINNELDKRNIYIKNSMEFAIFMASGMCFGLIAIADVFTPLFFGIQFMAASQLIKFMAPIILFKAWENVIRTQFLIPNCKDKIYINSTIIGALVNLITNYILIEKYGALGAVLGSLLGQITIYIYIYIYIKNSLNLIEYTKNSIKFLVAGFIMMIPVYTLGSIFNSSLVLLIIQLILGLVIYLSVIYIFFKNDKRLEDIVGLINIR